MHAVNKVDLPVHWLPNQGFNTFLQWCVDVVGTYWKSADDLFEMANSVTALPLAV